MSRILVKHVSSLFTVSLNAWCRLLRILMQC